MPFGLPFHQEGGLVLTRLDSAASKPSWQPEAFVQEVLVRCRGLVDGAVPTVRNELASLGTSLLTAASGVHPKWVES